MARTDRGVRPVSQPAGPHARAVFTGPAWIQGDDESELLRKVRLAREDWEDSDDDPAIHQAWIKFVLNDVLELSGDLLAEGQAIPQSLYCSAPEHGETLRPNLVLLTPKGRPDADKVRLLIQTYPADQELDKPVAGKPWKISPGTRMMELCHATDVRLGLVTNGGRWMGVAAPNNETTGFASWFADLWLEEPITLRAFRSLLNVERFFGVADKDTLESLLAESASNQQEVTEQLGYQVRNAVETIIQALDKADQEHNRSLLADVSETELYEAALNVMMRLVFLFCAEERDALLLTIRSSTRTTPSPRCGRSCVRRPTSKGKKSSNVVTMRGAVSSLRRFEPVHSGVEHGAEQMHLRPTPAICSIPIASLSSKVASEGRIGGRPPRIRCRSTIERCCTCSKLSNCCKSRCRGAGRPKPADSAFGHSTSNRSATSTKVYWITPQNEPPSRCWGWWAAGTKSRKSR